VEISTSHCKGSLQVRYEQRFPLHLFVAKYLGFFQQIRLPILPSGRIALKVVCLSPCVTQADHKTTRELKTTNKQKNVKYAALYRL
jgi:hypothetical protein